MDLTDLMFTRLMARFYSLLDCNDSKYLIARAIQFFVPGIPQVYYVGLLAGKNDLEAVARYRRKPRN